MGRFTIVCGGTGGHLTPGIAVAQRLTTGGHVCQLLVSRKRVDRTLAAQYPELDFVAVPGVAFSWRPIGLGRFLWSVLHGIAFALRHLVRSRPDGLLAFGGFLSVSWVVMARLMRIPIFLHEANRVPGRTVRLLARIADRVYLPDGVLLMSVPPRGIRHTGMPLRREIRHIPKAEIRQRMGIGAHEKLLVVIGGSQGAASLNDWAERHAASLAADGVSLFCVTGPDKPCPPDSDLVSDLGDPVRIRWISFCDDMAGLLSAADLVVSRAGAGAIAELIACLCPSILVPYPFAADNHQQANAAALEKRGGCVVIDQTRLSHLYREVGELIFNDWMLGQLRANLRSLGGRDPAEVIAADMVAVATAAQHEEEAA
jgi:UDP-N-acetylglucosamine--N-acetylmuramyl-(pentapeptide) pyrophosphoryl-undecaprenol N-acetylglucosamine transferase